MYRSGVARIHLLPDSVVNMIAAGEVVERPASVVKELVENALDAGARALTIAVEDGGRELVCVDDDGCGMSGEDALLAFKRHATSKIGGADDLGRLATLGFRGEALPSIAAVGEIVLETAEAPGDGTRVEIAFGQVRGSRPCARPRGTRVEVRGLFAQVPARRKFLRTAATELRHVLGAVTSLALTRPAVALTLRHGSRTLLELPAVATLEQRLPDLFGAARAREARPVELTSGAMQVTGFLLPSAALREVLLAVNGRSVRDRLLTAAAGRALRSPDGRLEAGAFLHLALPSGEVDVNVHPAKAEVRFADPGRVMAAVVSAIAAARPTLHGAVAVRRVVTVSPPERSFDAGRLFLSPTLAAPSRPGVAEPPPSLSPPASVEGAPRYLGQYRDTYLVVADDDGLLLVDQHVAHERILFEDLLARPEAPAVQRLLLPEVVELSPVQAQLAAELAADLGRLGLEVEPASAGAVRVLGVPTGISGRPAAVLLPRLLADLEEAAGRTSVAEAAAASLACQAAIKKNTPLPRAQAEHLLRQLATCQERHRCPHGRPIVLRLPHDEIERRIGRR